MPLRINPVLRNARLARNPTHEPTGPIVRRAPVQPRGPTVNPAPRRRPTAVELWLARLNGNPVVRIQNKLNPNGGSQR